MNKKLILWMVLLFTLGISQRLIPYENKIAQYSILFAILTMSASTLKHKHFGAVLPLLIMLTSDFVIGFYDGMIFNYAAMLIPALFVYYFNNKNSILSNIGFSVLAVLTFYVLSNLVAFFTMHNYPLSFSGFADCYNAGIPFIQKQLPVTVVATGILSFIYWAIVKNTKISISKAI